MTFLFPFAISQLGEMRVSVNRIQDFLMLEEREERVEEKGWGSQEEKEALLRGEEVKDVGPTVALRGVTAKWRKEVLEDTLADISMEVEAGQLVAIIGPVGSGKSSVLESIVGRDFPTRTSTVEDLIRLPILMGYAFIRYRDADSVRNT